MLNGTVNSQSKKCWYSSKSLPIHDFPVHDVAVRHMGNVSKIEGPCLIE